jgi:hypothetical protein
VATPARLVVLFIATSAVIAANTVLLLAGQDMESGSTSARLPQGLDGRRGSYSEILSSLRQLPFQSVKGSTAPATLSLANMLKEQKAWRTRLKSLEATFIHSYSRKFETPIEVDKKQKGMLLPEDYTDAIHAAVKGDKLYCEIWKPKQDNSKAGKRGTNVRYSYAFNGKQTRTFEPFRAFGQVKAGKTPGIGSQAAWYFDRFSFYAYRNDDRFDSSSENILAVLASPLFRVLPHLEEVDGSQCHVVTCDSYSFWLDAQLGCCVRRAVFIEKVSDDDPGCLSSVLVCKDFIEADQGIWLPTRCYLLYYTAQREPESIRGRLQTVQTVEVQRVKANAVDDSLFELEFPAGSQVLDLIKSKAYFVPHGQEMLDKAIAKANPIINGHVVPYARVQRPWWIWACNGIFAVILVYLVRRFYKTRVAKTREGA